MTRRRRMEDDETDSRAVEERAASGRQFDESESMADEQISPLHIPRDRWPEGKVLRWVRIEAANAIDNKNWASMTRVGWTPVDRAQYADLFPMITMPGQGDTSDGKVIFGGLVLCERDERLVARDKARQERATIEANEGIKEYVEQGPSQFPRFQDMGKVEYTRAVFKE